MSNLDSPSHLYYYHGLSSVLQLCSSFLPCETFMLSISTIHLERPGSNSIILRVCNYCSELSGFFKTCILMRITNWIILKGKMEWSELLAFYFTVILNHSSPKTSKHCQSLQCSAPKWNEDPSQAQCKVYLYGLSGHYLLFQGKLTWLPLGLFWF